MICIIDVVKAEKILIIILLSLFFKPHSGFGSVDNSFQASGIDNIATYNNSNIAIPLRLWRADPEIFKIIDSEIFPMLSMNEGGGFNNLGRAWIAWTIEINNQLFAAHAILDRGRLYDFTLSSGFYDTIYWKGAETSLFLVTSTNDTTFLTWYSTDKKPLQSSLDYNSTGHQILITQNMFQLFLYQNGTVPSIVTLEGYSLVTEIVDVAILSTIPNAALYLVKNDLLMFYSKGNSEVIPANFSINSQVGHVFLTPSIFDLVNKQVWWDGTIISIPNDVVELYTWGLKSSILRTSNNTLLEYNGFEWEVIKDYQDELTIQDFSIVDIGLYFGTIPVGGTQLLTLGDDEDGDGAPDTLESYFGSYPFKRDTDGDSIPDQVEIAYGMDPTVDDRNYDYDKDTMISIDEINLGLDPMLSDSDYGGAIDGWEFRYQYDPFDKGDDLDDSRDEDGVPNSIESIWNSSPDKKDTDSDGMPDLWEITYKLDPTDPKNAFEDNDGDSRNNLYEYNHGTDPLLPDKKNIFSGIELVVLLTLVITTPIALVINRKITNN